jgi:hypothetical protein
MHMPFGMDMGSDQNEGSMGSDTVMTAVPGHSMYMFPSLEMPTQRIEQATEPEMKTGATHDNSKSVSSCTRETCSQVSDSASPPGADHIQPSSLHRMAISISSPPNVWFTFHWIRPGTPPPKFLTADRLLTTLRI